MSLKFDYNVSLRVSGSKAYVSTLEEATLKMSMQKLMHAPFMAPDTEINAVLTCIASRQSRTTFGLSLCMTYQSTACEHQMTCAAVS